MYEEPDMITATRDISTYHPFLRCSRHATMERQARAAWIIPIVAPMPPREAGGVQVASQNCSQHYRGEGVRLLYTDVQSAVDNKWSRRCLLT